MFQRNNYPDTGKEVRFPEKLIWTVVRRHFPFLMVVVEHDQSWIDDINQTAWLCFYQTGGNNFRDFYNACQRELYRLAKALGFRRTRKNQWIIKEVNLKEEEEK